MKQKLAVLILILAGIIAYANTAKNGLFWDDDEFITRNVYIRSFRYLPQWFSQPMTAGAGVNSNYYRPMLQLSLAIDYKLWGLWPGGYHLENILWHAAAGILLYFFLFVILSGAKNPVADGNQRDPSSRHSSGLRMTEGKIAFAASLLWLVHPVNVEAVAYANSRGDSMATAFILLTLILWMKKRFRASAVVFIFALLSKEFAIVTPGLILLIESLRGVPMAIGTTRQSHKIPTAPKTGPRNDGKVIGAFSYGSLRSLQYAGGVDVEKFRKLLTEKLYRLLTIVVNLYNFTKPIFLHITIAVIYLILRLTVLNFQNTLNFYGSSLQRSNLCAQQRLDLCSPLELYATTLSARLMTFLKVLPIYGRILVWPNDLHMERTVEIATTFNKEVFISLIVIISILTASILILYKGQAFRRKAWPFQIIPLATGWFFISILPVSGIIPISQILAEHFLYLPSIGFFMLVGYLIAEIANIIGSNCKTVKQYNSKTVISESVASNPASRATSLPVYRSTDYCHTVLPSHRSTDTNFSFLNNLFLFLMTGLIATPLLIRTIRQNRIWRDPITFYEYTLAHAEPTARVYNNLAMAYADAGDHQKAINNYQLAISLGDVYPNPHYNLGNTLVELGKLDEAEKEYKRALEIDPSFHYATLKLGQMYIDQGKIDAAKNLVCPVFHGQPLCRHY